MNSRFPHFAIMAFLFGSLAFASQKTESTGSDGPTPATGTSQASTTSGTNPCVSDHDKENKDKKNKKKDKNKAKPAPSDQEREFDRLLLGMYG